MTCVQRHVSGHDPLPPVPFPRSSFVMPVSDWLSARTDGTSGECTICGFARRPVAGQESAVPGGRQAAWAMNPESGPVVDDRTHRDVRTSRAVPAAVPAQPAALAVDRASVSQLIPYLLRKVRLAGQGGGYRPHCQPRMRTRRAAAIRPAARPPPASCPMLSGEPTYDCASVTNDLFPGKPGHDKAPWTIRQDHPGGKAPALGTHHET